MHLATAEFTSAHLPAAVSPPQFSILVVAADLAGGHRIADHLLEGEQVMIGIRTAAQVRAGLPVAEPHLVLVSGAALARDDPAEGRAGLVQDLRHDHRDALMLVVVDEPGGPETGATATSGADGVVEWPINEALLRTRLSAHVRWSRHDERGSDVMAVGLVHLLVGVCRSVSTAFARLRGLPS